MRGTLVIISSISWHFTWQRHHDIAEGFHKRGYQVIFVGPIPKKWPSLSEIAMIMCGIIGVKPKQRGSYQEIPGGLSIITPLMLPETNRLTVRLNETIFIPLVVGKIEKCLGPSPLLLIQYVPISGCLTLQEKLTPAVAVYDCVTDWEKAPWGKKLLLIEEELARSVDGVFTDSPYLYQKMKRIQKETQRLLPANHYAMFKPARSKIQRDLTEKPIVCYFGSVNNHLDIPLLRKLSYQYRLRIIGPVHIKPNGFSEDTEIVRAVPHDKIPAQLKEVDVLIFPYTADAFVKAIIPAKTFEALATGKPVVSIGLSSLEEFSDYFYLSINEEEFFANIDKALREPAPLVQKRLKFAEENDWRYRIDTLENFFLQELEKKNSGMEKTEYQR